MIVLIMFIMRIPLKDKLVMIIPIVFVLLTLSPWFPPIFCSHRGATVEVLLFKTTVNGLIGIPSLSITITFKPMNLPLPSWLELKSSFTIFYRMFYMRKVARSAPFLALELWFSYWHYTIIAVLIAIVSGFFNASVRLASQKSIKSMMDRPRAASGSWVKPLVAYGLIIGMIVGQ